MTAKPTATLVSSSSVSTRYLVQFPAVGGVQGVAYRATTYPRSALLSLENAATGRSIALGQAVRLVPLVRAAIAEAGGVQWDPAA